VFQGSGRGLTGAAVVPNPKLKLMDPVREVLRLKHQATALADAIGRTGDSLLCDPQNGKEKSGQKAKRRKAYAEHR
jgi:hypothetical protein